MSLRRTLYFLMVMCLGANMVFAQDPDYETVLGEALDRAAAQQGLPSGDGSISPAEQQIASSLEPLMRDIDTQAHQQASISLGDQLVVDSIEQGIQEYNAFQKQMENLSPADRMVVESLIKGELDYAEYVEQMANLSPADQRLVQTLEEGIRKYAHEDDFEIPMPDVKKAVKDGANHYIDNSNIEYKEIVRRNVGHLIEIMVPSQQLPINGYWRVRPYNMSVSGSCLSPLGGDNGGNGGEWSDDPGMPLCGYANEGGLPFIIWENSSHPYLPGTSSIYSQDPIVRREVMQDVNGESIGSLRITTTKEYEVVSPSEIHVHLVIAEDDGCTLTADYVIELVTADESVCPALTGTFDPSTGHIPSDENPQDSSENPEGDQPIVPSEAPYQVGSPIFVDEQSCNDANMPPQFSEVTIRPNGEGSLLIDYGTGTQAVYEVGDGFYEYSNGFIRAFFETIYLNIDANGTGSIFWSINSKDGNICAVTLPFAQPGVENPLMATSTPEPVFTPESPVSPTHITEGRYSVQWTLMEMLCPADMQSNAPSFEEVTISQPDEHTLILDYGSGQFTLTDEITNGDFMLMDMSDPTMMNVISFVGDESGTAFLSWSSVILGDEPVSCVVMADLAVK